MVKNLRPLDGSGKLSDYFVTALGGQLSDIRFAIFVPDNDQRREDNPELFPRYLRHSDGLVLRMEGNNIPYLRIEDGTNDQINKAVADIIKNTDIELGLYDGNDFIKDFSYIRLRGYSLNDPTNERDELNYYSLRLI